jgi:TolB-like protein/Tfp pilus assembly protein PilF
MVDPVFLWNRSAAMPDLPSKAIFISHASQDNLAAQRICDGLRSKGVEVWFDSDGGLEHGDEWDAKIRRQIKECVLFLPLISAATQARHEGYFRIEWDLAAERARGFASGVPFILPILIDDTREPEALVPDRFRTVQWTKLPEGLVTPEFLSRFLKVWSHRTGVLAQQATQAAGGALPTAAEAKPPAVGPGPWRWVVGALIIAGALLVPTGWYFMTHRSTPPADIRPEPAPAPAAVVPAVAPNSVAVLPFENLSDDKANEYFSDGISEELLSVLTKVPGLHVAARTSAFSFKGKNATAQEIGEKLHVAHLVEGSVRRAGNSVRIAARLSRAASGEELWSETYTRDLNDVFAVQSELAQTIVAQLRQQLGAPQAPALVAAQVQAAERGGTSNPEAHQLYLQGRYFVDTATLENVLRAKALLQKAVDLDPRYTLAWVQLTFCGGLINGFASDRAQVDEGLKLERLALDRALALDPDIVPVLLAESGVEADFFDWARSAAALARARQIDPNSYDVLYSVGYTELLLGHAEAGVASMRQAAALNPVDPLVHTFLGFGLLGLHRYDEARAEFHQVHDISPDFPFGYGGLACVAMAEGKEAEALAWAEQTKTEWLALWLKAAVLWRLGRRSFPADADHEVSRGGRLPGGRGLRETGRSRIGPEMAGNGLPADGSRGAADTDRSGV